MDELKPCPFCGSVPSYSMNHELVYCRTGGCAMNVIGVGVAAWNTRTPDAALVAENATLEAAVLSNQEGIRDLNNTVLELRDLAKRQHEMLRDILITSGADLSALLEEGRKLLGKEGE